MKYLRLFFLMIFLSSCNNEIKKTTSEFKTISIKSGPKNQHIDSARFRTLVEGNIKRYEYKTFENDSTFYQFIEKEINNDSVLIVRGNNCKLISSHHYQFNSEEIKIQAYLYDIPSVFDDESIFYFNNELGLILEQSIAWANASVLYNEEGLKPLQDSINYNFNRFNLIDKVIKMSKD